MMGSMYCWCIGLCLVIFVLPSPSEGNKLTSSSKEEVTLDKRQSSCSSNSDCFPDNITAVPSDLIQCFSSRCLCSECFTQDSDGRCAVEFPGCYDFSTATLRCDDERRSQLVALLLSIFLSGVGAANFYIEQTSLAAGQLSLFIIVILLPCCLACIPCCIFCCIAGGEEAKGSVVFILLFTVVFIVIFAGSLAMFAWWIADVVIFATNARDAGDGCPLKPISS